MPAWMIEAPDEVVAAFEPHPAREMAARTTAGRATRRDLDMRDTLDPGPSARRSTSQRCSAIVTNPCTAEQGRA
ncbi:hypothetical protein GCM10028801_20450 [Nocardioides maradonensis]